MIFLLIWLPHQIILMGFLENRIVREIDETNKRDYFTTVFTFRETNEV